MNVIVIMIVVMHTYWLKEMVSVFSYDRSYIYSDNMMPYTYVWQNWYSIRALFLCSSDSQVL